MITIQPTKMMRPSRSAAPTRDHQVASVYCPAEGTAGVVSCHALPTAPGGGGLE